MNGNQLASTQDAPKGNLPGKKTLFLYLAGFLAACLLLFLPFYRFTAEVYTKKSGNTFVGDERYKEARAEVEAEAEKYREMGFAVEIGEEVTERTNSKGETTSLITFSVRESFGKRGIDFLLSSLPSAWALRIIYLGLFLSLLFLFLSRGETFSTELRYVSPGIKRLRGLSCFCLLVSFLSAPVFLLMSNYGFWRKTGLYKADLLPAGKEEWYGKLDAFLFDKRMGEGIDSALKKLSASPTVLILVLVLALFVALLGVLPLRFGELKKPLLRGLLYAFMLLVCVVTLYPYYVMLITAFRSNSEALDMYFLHLLPTKWLWGNLKDILSRGVLTYLKNSFMVAGGATLLAMLCGIPAAFAMARMNFKGKKFFLGFVIMSQM
ncbi:MAG: carbohydrate ABC transporter permease, partial [Blautia sp.]|nr:carbohydrate ABC transporter permease [Blautia sp.]